MAKLTRVVKMMRGMVVSVGVRGIAGAGVVDAVVVDTEARLATPLLSDRDQ
jgi:hypothetical protein